MLPYVRNELAVAGAHEIARVAEQLHFLARILARHEEQQLMRDWVEQQSDEQKSMRETLEKLAVALKERERG